MPASAARIVDPAAVTRRLLRHYDAHARPLPWRSPPGAVRQDPYKVWLSEVMLQQTTVATVRPRFRRFIERWSTVEALAAAPAEDVLKEWAGLGYYARARNLHACAGAVAARSGFPTTEAELRKLPGLGAYTAGAIAAIAFGERAAAIDTNVERVIARLAAISLPVAEARAEIHAEVEALLPADRPGDFAQAMMDLGATICRPRKPDCPVCPLRPDCAAFASGAPESFPAPKPKRDRPQRHGTAWWIQRGETIWLVRRPARGLLGGMPSLPGPDWSDEPTTDGPPPLTRIEWGFTHFTITLAIVARAEPPADEGWWHPIATLNDVGLPSLYAKAVAAVLSSRAADAA